MIEHRLAHVRTDAEWDSYHAIREHVLFEARGRFGVYDRNHPDEHLQGNYPFLLLLGTRPIGVIRIDVQPPIAYFRRVAIIPELQRLGHGSVLLRLAENFASHSGCSTILSNVDANAVPFYSRLGFATDPARDAAPSVAMLKSL